MLELPGLQTMSTMFGHVRAVFFTWITTHVDYVWSCTTCVLCSHSVVILLLLWLSSWVKSNCLASALVTLGIYDRGATSNGNISQKQDFNSIRAQNLEVSMAECSNNCATGNLKTNISSTCVYIIKKELCMCKRARVCVWYCCCC